MATNANNWSTVAASPPLLGYKSARVPGVKVQA